MFRIITYLHTCYFKHNIGNNYWKEFRKLFSILLCGWLTEFRILRSAVPCLEFVRPVEKTGFFFFFNKVSRIFFFCTIKKKSAKPAPNDGLETAVEVAPKKWIGWSSKISTFKLRERIKNNYYTKKLETWLSSRSAGKIAVSSIDATCFVCDTRVVKYVFGAKKIQ